MERITHDADDKALQKSIDVFNDRLTEHQQAAAAIREPPSVSDDECAVMTVGMVETHRAGLESERLKHRQDAVALARDRVAILEGIEAETKGRADAADSSYDDIHQKTARALTKAGCGISAQRADEHSPAGRRQFEQSILQSVDVQAASVKKKHHRGQVGHTVQQVVAAKASLQDATQELRQFAITSITGNQNGHEAQDVGRENRRKSVFQKAR